MTRIEKQNPRPGLYVTDEDLNFVDVPKKYPNTGYLDPDHSRPENKRVIGVSRFATSLHESFTNDEGQFMAGSKGFAEELVLAIVRPTLLERFKQILRYGWLAPVHDYPWAVYKSADTCERCMNAMLHRYGLERGYREHSEEWHRAGTSCYMCDGDTVSRCFENRDHVRGGVGAVDCTRSSTLAEKQHAEVGVPGSEPDVGGWCGDGLPGRSSE
jgi:hypothetical protein